MNRFDRADLQALVIEPYRCPLARHLLFAVRDPRKGREFLNAWVDSVAAGDLDRQRMPPSLVNLSFTWNGLKALDAFAPFGGTARAEEAFPWHFKDEPDMESLRLGADLSPSSWWGGKFDGDQIHLIVHLAATTDEALETVTAETRRSAEAAAMLELIPTDDGEAITGRAFAGRQIHFGYQDGISHPPVNWDGLPDRPDLLPRGMFVVDDWMDDAQSFPRHSPFRELCRNGSYLAFTWIYQDVAAFRTYLAETGPRVRPDLPHHEAKEWLAAKLMGRWRSGAPLELAPEHDDPSLAAENGFDYVDDAEGVRCPFAAHVRIVNARGQELNFRNRSMFPAGFPQLLRRGTPYGDDLVGETDDGKDRGVVGMFLCANVNQQFYSLTRWMGKTDFSDVYRNVRGQDPIFGHRGFRGASADFEIPVADAPPIVLKQLPQFVRLKGAAIAFMPSLTALRMIAAHRGPN